MSAEPERVKRPLPDSLEDSLDRVIEVIESGRFRALLRQRMEEHDRVDYVISVRRKPGKGLTITLHGSQIAHHFSIFGFQNLT